MVVLEVTVMRDIKNDDVTMWPEMDPGGTPGHVVSGSLFEE